MHWDGCGVECRRWECRRWECRRRHCTDAWFCRSPAPATPTAPFPERTTCPRPHAPRNLPQFPAPPPRSAHNAGAVGVCSFRYSGTTGVIRDRVISALAVTALSSIWNSAGVVSGSWSGVPGVVGREAEGGENSGGSKPIRHATSRHLVNQRSVTIPDGMSGVSCSSGTFYASKLIFGIYTMRGTAFIVSHKLRRVTHTAYVQGQVPREAIS